ncbi:fungal hydrophobin [Trametes versicolor FP-101664 SS1]|uniref:fungal hydrophobin n=1 Tax=Trametes versicolor (strain FP-101664) TaxID=717944 RepID=UPI0004621EB0|nr:fungal hydrophobin [Trametes versicolor FP-101664 SS1]EIW55701.1 fungal hydrophobin [Trametes versicolor FP-101664 SS1]
MVARLSTALTVASIALLAVATPNGKRWGTTTASKPQSTPAKTVTVTKTAPASGPTEPASSCSTGPIQCCNSVQSASSPAGSLLLGLLGVVVQGVDVLLGLDCSPISVIGVGGGECNANAVCCQNNAVGGLISIGCVPVIL